MKTKLFRFASFLIAMLLCVPFLCSVSALAADDEEEVNKWDVLQAKYTDTPFNSVEDRIYAEGPDATEDSEKKGYIRSMFQILISDDGYAIYADASTGEIVCLKLAKDGDGKFYPHPSYADKPILTLNGEEAYIMAYTGYWSTNPYTIGGINANAKIKAELYSQVNIEFTENNQAATYYSFIEAALLNQIKVSNIKNGARVEYTIGQEAVKYLVPRFITTEKYNALYEEVVAGLLEEYAGNESYANFYAEKFAQGYKEITSYSTSDADYIKDSIDQFGSCTQLNSKTGKKNTLLIEEYLKKYTDYSYEQLDADHDETGYVATDKDPAVFKMAIEYTVDDQGLVVRCVAGNIRFDSGVYKLSNVYLLPYAGAGNTNNEGYALYPDGSGSIIDFAGTKGKTFITTTTAYGQDYSYSTISGANNEVARLPVFGMVEKETKADGSASTRGYLAYVEEGESLANITLKASGATHLYLQTYTAFNPRPKDTYSLSGGISTGADAMWTVESKRKYTKNYKLRIFILEEGNSSYSAMAEMLRDYIISKGTIKDPAKVAEEHKDGNKDIPLVLETLGAIKSSKRVLGVPVSTMKALTSFSDIQTSIVDKLKKPAKEDVDPIENIVVKLNGWLDGGLTYDVPTGVEIEDALGGASGFKKLIAYCKENGIELYPDFDFTYSRKDSMFDDFDPDEDLARTIDDRKAYKKEYYPIFQSYDYSGLGVISANRMMRLYDKTYADYKKYDVGAISVSTLGQYLNSDFNPDNPLTREDAKVLIDRLLGKVSEENGDVMLSGGNIFSVKYADYILDMPLEDSKFKYATASIPFVSMVLHGSVEYAGTALNLSGDFQNAVLKYIENGAIPYFVVAVQNTSELKNDPDYSKYYSVRYSIWQQDIYDTYNRMNSALSDVRFETIASHEFIDSGNSVAKVIYSNGVSFVINHLDKAYTYYDNGEVHTVAAKSFIKFDAEGNIVKI